MPEARRYVVLTAVGPDRPGLVRQMAAAVQRAEANLEDSRMALLGGEFALIMLVSGGSSVLAQLDSQRSSLEAETGLTISLKATEPTPPKDYLPYHLDVSGVDHPGIVSSVSNLLAERRINVSSLETRVSYAPLSGTPMFSLNAQLQIPSELELAALRRELHQVCENENLDFELKSARS